MLPVNRLLKILPLACALPLATSAAPLTAFHDGESFSYKVSFIFFMHAGDIVISAHQDKLDGKDVFRIATDTSSHGFVRGVYAFDNQAAVVVDQATGRLLSVKERGADPKRTTDTEAIFDYAKRVVHYTDRVRKERSGDFGIPDGDPLDLISALVQTRAWGLKPGEKRDMLVNFGSDFFPLVITADHYETVRTPLGSFKTLVLIPRMEKNPQGLFKRGGEIKVWISQDAQALPVKMQLKLNFGSATLLLNKYDAGSPAAPAPAKK